MAEHTQCRTQAALFDVSHMGQLSLHGDGAAAALEALVPGDIAGLKPGRQRYTLLLNEAGGILDDLMVANLTATGCSWSSTPAARTSTAHIARAAAGGVTLERPTTARCWRCRARRPAP